jgi:RNA polymerase sigma-70 factor, ECF subfamily
MTDAHTGLLDPALEGAAAAADPEAFAAVWQQREAMVKAVIVRRLGPGSDAVEDLAAEVWTRAWAAVRSGAFASRTGSAGMSGWLCRIARNVALDYARAPANTKPRTSIEETGELAAADAGPDAAAIDAETAQEIRAMLASLPDAQRRCLELRYLAGLDLTETAEIIGRGIGATKALQHRGLMRLQRNAIRDGAARGLE